MSETPDTEATLPQEPSLDEPRFERVPVPVFTEEPEEKPRHCVIGNELVSQTDDGELRLPLRVPFGMVEELEDKTPRDQLYTVLAQRPQLIERINGLDFIDAGDVIRKFWQALGEKEQARLGESLRLVGQPGSTVQP